MKPSIFWWRRSGSSPEAERLDEQQKMERGRQAEALLANPALGAALRNMRLNYLGAIEATTPEEAAKREHMYNMLACLLDFGAELNDVIRRGQNAATTQKQQEEREQNGRRTDYPGRTDTGLQGRHRH